MNEIIRLLIKVVFLIQYSIEKTNFGKIKLISDPENLHQKLNIDIKKKRLPPVVFWAKYQLICTGHPSNLGRIAYACYLASTKATSGKIFFFFLPSYHLNKAKYKNQRVLFQNVYRTDFSNC